VATTLTSATHSNSGNLQSSYVLSSTHSNTGNMSVGGTLSCGTLTNQTRKIWNAGKLNVWGSGGSNYYLLATSPNDSAGNSAGGLRISGSVGGFFRDNLCQLDCTITNRVGIRYLSDAYGAILEAQKWCDIVVYNSNNVQWQYLLATYQLFSGFDIEVSQGDFGLGIVLQEPTATPFYSNLVFNTSNTSLGSVLSNLNLRCETATMITTISSNMTVNGTLIAANLQGSLSWTYLSNTPPLLSNSSSIGWINIVNIPSYASLTQYMYTSNQAYFGSNSLVNYATLAQYQYTSNQANYSSNALASVATSLNYVWSSNSLRSNVNDVSFSSNVSVGLGITADSLTTNDLFTNNTINAQTGI
jgi:hypothetical protein